MVSVRRKRSSAEKMMELSLGVLRTHGSQEESDLVAVLGGSIRVYRMAGIGHYPVLDPADEGGLVVPLGIVTLSRGRSR